MEYGILIAAVIALSVAAIARRYSWPAPLVLVAVGLGLGWIPGLPDVELHPEAVLFLILPPLLYSASIDSSYHAIRDSKRGILMLALGLPVFSTVAVGVAAHLLLPQLPLAAALVLGAVVAPPDAVSAQAIGRQVGLPRRVMTLLGGESLLNDATALTLLRVALAAAVGETTSVGRGVTMFLVAAVGGTALGMIVGYFVSWVRTKLTDPPLESAVGFVVPFATYYIAEELHSSGVIAVVVAGLFLGQRSARDSYTTRLQDNGIRKSLDVLLESFVFLLIGLQLPALIDGLSGESPVRVGIDAAVILAIVIVSRFVWVYPATYFSRIFRRVRESEPEPNPRAMFIISWAGMRGVVSLAAAFTIPLTLNNGSPFPARGEILFLTFVVVVGTLLIQGTTLGWFAKKLGVVGDEDAQDRLAFATAQDKASRASEKLLDELAAELSLDDPYRHKIAMQRKWVMSQRNTAWESLGRGVEEIGESPTAAADRMRGEILRVQRAVFIEERDAGRLDDEVLRMALRRLDFAEGAIDREGD
ncbi:Na+/H+ antiporter [Gordonia sp. TBRC 11910]|uniref:Na+/H+ antiporter n=1 Tax=Gordonia asplenii TaxID=2725283 RepID=A0A848KY56_9ACTN|nr:Na+/H+ antiporter [Gordonia asplenii]NMO03600.1 Na+/H+ antiporter [Gordonia asplenii]